MWKIWTAVTMAIMLAGSFSSSAGASSLVTGQVVDSQGRPVAGAKILVSSSVYYNANTFVLTGEDGRYSLQVPQIHVNTSWHVYGSVERQYNGRTYTMSLHPETVQDFNGSGPPVVRNFRWVLTGEQVGREHGRYGAVITVGAEIGAFYDYENVRLTLTPTGPLIDGNPGKRLDVRVSAEQQVEVPLGRYTLTATHMPPGGAQAPMQVRVRNKGAYARSMTVDFDPEGRNCKNCLTIEVKP